MVFTDPVPSTPASSDSNQEANMGDSMTYVESFNSFPSFGKLDVSNMEENSILSPSSGFVEFNSVSNFNEPTSCDFYEHNQFFKGCKWLVLLL